MPLETGTYISDLAASNPAHTDGLNNADAHIRLIKSVLLATFPNLIGATDCTADQLTTMDARTWQPGDIKIQGHGTIGTGWLECDGSTVSQTTYAALYAKVAGTWNTGGEAGGTFRLPNFANRYPRGRGSSAVGAYLSADIAAHAHSTTVTNPAASIISGSTNTTGGHSHGGSFAGSGSGSTDTTGAHSHKASTGSGPVAAGTTWALLDGAFNSAKYTDTQGDHSHAVSVSVSGSISTDTQGNHSHTVSGTVTSAVTVTVNNSTGSETRPASAVVVYLIKT